MVAEVKQHRLRLRPAGLAGEKPDLICRKGFRPTGELWAAFPLAFPARTKPRWKWDRVRSDGPPIHSICAGQRRVKRRARGAPPAWTALRRARLACELSFPLRTSRAGRGTRLAFGPVPRRPTPTQTPPLGTAVLL